MSAWCEFGYVDSDREVVINVGNVLAAVPFPEDVDFVWLSERLQLSTDGLWRALELPNNEAFVSALYTAKARDWNYFVFERPHNPLMDEPEPPRIAMPASPPPQADALDWLSTGQETRSDWFLFWSLPAAELWLPKNIAAMTYSPAIDTYQSAHRRKCISVGVGEPTVSLTVLKDGVRALRRAIQAGEERAQQALRHIVFLQKMLGVVELQIRDWKHPWTRIDDDERERRVARIKTLRELERRLETLLERVVDEVEVSSDQDRTADALLEMLAPSGIIGGELKRFFHELEHRPTVVSAKALDAVVAALTDTFEALARSSRAEVFLRDHLLEILELTCENTPPGFDKLVGELEDESLRYELTEGWRGVFTQTRRAVGTGPSTPLAGVGRLSGYYRALVGIAGAAMHDVMVGRMLAALGRASEDELPTLMRSVSGFLLRFLSTHGWLHRGADADTILFGRDLDYRVVLEQAMAPPGDGDVVDWSARGRALNQDWRIQAGLLRSPGGVSIAILAAFATFAYSASDDGKNVHARALDMAGGIAGVGEAFTRATELVAIRGGDAALVKTLSERIGRLGALAAAFGAFSAAICASQERRRGNAYGMWTHRISAMSSGLSLAGWVLAGRLLMTSFCASGLGVILGAVAIALVVFERELRDGPDYLIDAYWTQVIARGSPVRALTAEVDGVSRALKEAFEQDALDDFHMRVGSSGGDLQPTDPPTFHAAHAIGFEQREIATMFGVRAAIVREMAGIEAVDHER